MIDYMKETPEAVHAKLAAVARDTPELKLPSLRILHGIAEADLDFDYRQQDGGSFCSRRLDGGSVEAGIDDAGNAWVEALTAVFTPGVVTGLRGRLVVSRKPLATLHPVYPLVTAAATMNWPSQLPFPFGGSTAHVRFTAEEGRSRPQVRLHFGPALAGATGKESGNCDGHVEILRRHWSLFAAEAETWFSDGGITELVIALPILGVPAAPPRAVVSANPRQTENR